MFIFRVLLIFNILEVDSTNRREIFIDSLLACVGEIVSRGDEATNSRTYTMYREQKVTELVRFTRRLWEGKSAKGGPEVCSAGALGDVIVFFVFRVFEKREHTRPRGRTLLGISGACGTRERYITREISNNDLVIFSI